MPTETPVTTPPVTVALALLALQTPPAVTSVSEILLPIHTDDGPGKMGAGLGITVTVLVAEHPSTLV